VKVSERWLREWLEVEGDAVRIAEQLTMAGLEVDGVAPCAPPLAGVVVGRVLEVGQHPDADRLSLCQVDVGAAAPLQIVCGASNVRAGGAYPVATAGTRLPDGLKIKRGKLRGQVSEGMLCSAAELGLAENAAGLLDLPAEALPGTAVTELLGLDDTVIDIDLTPNRADCFSMLGVARDLAAINGVQLAEPEVPAVAPTEDESVGVVLDAGAACPVFASRVISGIDPNAVTPLWMTERLRRAGIKSLYPAVDVTNYVLLELGQPMHAYDRARLQGEFVVRWARPGETLELINTQTAELDSDVLVVADATGPLGMAGVMGGAASAVSAATIDIVLESAFFAPSAVAGRARRFGLHTDASLRFERGVDFSNQVRALERATQLLLDIAGGRPGPVHEQRMAAHLPPRPAVHLRRERLARVLGLELDDNTVAELLQRLGLEVVAVSDGWDVTPSAARFDIAIEEDLIEEVARLHGYGRVPAVAQPAPTQLAAATETRVAPAQLRATLASRGYLEVVTYSFVDPAEQELLLGAAPETRLANPLASDMAVMRRSLLPGLLAVLSANRKRQQERVRVFEYGVTFGHGADAATESVLLGGLVWGSALPEHWSGGAARPVDIFDIKSDLDALAQQSGFGNGLNYVKAEHAALRPGRTARVERDGAVLGWLGELHPRICRAIGLATAPVVFELDATGLREATPPRYRAVSRFPSVRRDLAVLVAEEVPASDLVDVARMQGGAVLRDVIVFDVYTGDAIEKGLKSVALGLILQETSSTLTEPEIDRVVHSVVTGFSERFNASIRE
jgi:phenylalanyl-tRNA synthetase beta chain